MYTQQSGNFTPLAISMRPNERLFCVQAESKRGEEAKKEMLYELRRNPVESSQKKWMARYGAFALLIISCECGDKLAGDLC
ncbi:Uncharacterized protein APZ42_025300 [Daphnia magna]|uniref:Uncharacterized protein n=1 Tax=Daphnia magna TaxID=35525 RepID=A0A164T8Z8_9CRUS|nr:Uncharacterized protein APZ42_025300 [Daphnia magna]